MAPKRLPPDPVAEALVLSPRFQWLAGMAAYVPGESATLERLDTDHLRSDLPDYVPALFDPATIGMLLRLRLPDDEGAERWFAELGRALALSIIDQAIDDNQNHVRH